MGKDKISEINLKPTDIYGLPTTFITMFFPSFLFLMLGLMLLKDYQGQTEEVKTSIVTIVLLFALAACFVIGDIIVVLYSYYHFKGTNGEVDLARVFQSDSGIIGVSYFDNMNRQLLGRAQGFFFIMYNSTLFRRGERVFIYTSDKKIPVLLNKHGVKRLIGTVKTCKSQPEEEQNKPSETIGFKKNCFLSTIFFDFAVILGIVLVCLSSPLMNTSTSMLSLFILGIAITVIGLAYMIIDTFIATKHVKSLLAKKGRIVTMKAKANIDKKILDGTYQEENKKPVVYPLIGSFSHKYLLNYLHENEVYVYLNDDGEAIVLKNRK